jgi:predicted dehydrogenase
MVFPASGAGLGYADSLVQEVFEFLESIENKNKAEPSFYDGWKVSEIIEAIRVSSSSSKWVDLA